MAKRTALTGIGLALHGALCAMLAAPAGAQTTYPSREVTLIVPFNPGGSTDIIGRGFAESLKVALGQPVTVQNVPGAGTATGFTKLAEARPDGHTLAVLGPFMISTALRGQLKVPLADYTYIARLSQETFVLGVPSTSAVRSLTDYAAAAKKSAGAVNVGTAGSGTLTHLTAAALSGALGAELNIVHFQGGGKLTPAVLGGHVDSGVFSQVEILGHVGAAGGLRVLSVFADQRSKKLPDVPTLREQGISGVPAGPWQGIVAPKGLPAPVRAALTAAVTRAAQDPAWLDFLDKNGLAATFAAGADLDAFLKTEIATTEKLLRQIGLSP